VGVLKGELVGATLVLEEVGLGVLKGEALVEGVGARAEGETVPVSEPVLD
jgi:hypothetical protein